MHDNFSAMCSVAQTGKRTLLEPFAEECGAVLRCTIRLQTHTFPTGAVPILSLLLSHTPGAWDRDT